MKLLMVAVTVTIKHKNNDRQIEKDLRLVWGMFKCEFPPGYPNGDDRRLWGMRSGKKGWLGNTGEIGDDRSQVKESL